MKIPFLPSIAFVAFTGLAFSPVLRAEPLVGIVGQNMIAFDSTTPGTTTFLATLAGLDIFEQVHAIERKPVSGELFVLTNLSGPGGGYKLRSAYSTGANTVLGSSFVISGSTKWAFALQPDNTTLRVVSNNGVNLRLDSATGARTTDSTLAYAAGDVAFGTVPRVGALVTLDNGTTYGVDIANWNLVTLDPAPSGTLHTVGSTGLALTGSISVNLDISGSSGTAFLSVGDNSVPRTELYTLNLGTGALSSLGQLGNSEIVLALAAGVVSPPPATATDIAWAGGSGLTSVAANWNPAQLPTSLDTVRIHTGAPRVDATLDVAHLINDRTLTFTNGSLNVHASLTNDGSIHLNGATSQFFGNLGIYGSGNIFLEGGTLASGNNADTLFNLGNNIQGAGFIPGIFVNQTNGVVTAGDNGVLHLDRPVANFGSMNASDGSLLAFSGGQPGTLDNSGGTIQANFGGAVFLAGPISGGRIVNNQNEPGEITGALPGSPQQIRSPPGAGVFLGSFSAFPEDVEFNTTRASVALEGTDSQGSLAEFSLLRGMSLNLKGSLQNNGVIRTYGNQTDGLARIYVLEDTVIAGTGRIELGWAGRDGDEIIGFDHTLSLFPGQLLTGGGKVFTRVDNFNSTIRADRASATEGTYPLRFYEPIGNYGLMRAQNNGALDVHSSTLTQYDSNYNTVGHVEAGSGGSVTFHGTEIIGGALVQSAGQSAFVYHFATLDGESAPGLELYGTHRAGGEDFDSLSVRGAIEFNSGATLELVDGATLYSMGFPELTGLGLVYLGAGGGESYVDIPASEALHNGIAIAGVGSIGGSGVLFNRPGANVQAYAGTLYTFGPVDNQGVLEAGGRPADGGQNVAGTLTIASPVFNDLGLVRVNNDLSKLVLYGGSIVGGTIETRGSIPSATATVDLYGKLEDVSLVNNLWALGDTYCDLAGTIRFLPGIFSDSYLVAGGTLGQTSQVAIVGSVILDGPGGVWLVDPDLTLGHSRLVQGDSDPGTLEKVTLRNGARIRGAGLVDVDVYNEGGTILADTPGGSLIIADGRLKNRGAAIPAFTNEQILANPLVLRPDLALGAVQAANGATVVIQQSNVLRQQLQATGAGKIVLNGLAPFLSNLHILLEDTAELAAPALLTLGTGVSLALSGDQLPGLPGASSCDIPNSPLPTGPALKVNGLVGQDGSTLVAAGGGNVQTTGADLVGQDGSTLTATRGGALVGNDGASLVGQDGSTLVGNDGGTLIGLDGGSLVGQDGSTLKALNGGNLVAAGGGNIEAAGGSLVAAGGGNIANTATGGLVAAGGLNGLAGGPPAYGKLLIKNGGDLTSDASNIRVSGGDRNTVMADNQLGGRMDLKNRSCMKIPSGRFRNTGTLKAAQSNVVTGFFQNVGNTVVSGVSWVWNGAVGAVTGVVNGVGGVINATGSFFGRLFGGAALAEGGEGFALAGLASGDALDFINEGTFILGDGICTNTVDMGFTQTNTGRLSVQLGGTATNGYDRLFINGPTVLGGTLQLVFTNNFAPTLGDTFDFLVCPDVIGNFDIVEIAGLPAGHNWQYHAVFTNGAYRVVSDSSVVLPIGAFRALHGLAADGSQDYANPSGDRIPNLFKYAFNLAPNAGDLNTARYKVLASAADTSGLPRLIPNLDGSFTYVYVRRKASTVPGISYHPEIDTTLSGTWIALVPTQEVQDSIDATWERVRMTLGNPLPAPYTSGAFLRVRVER